MILILFIFFILLGVILLFLGQSISNPSLQIAGSVLFFLLGVVLMFGGISYYSGNYVIYEYGNNFTDYHWEDYDGASEPPTFTPSDDAVYLFHTENTKLYSSLPDTVIAGGVDVEHIIGFLLSVIGISSFVSIMMSLGRFRE